MRVSDLVVRCLENEGVKYIFGVPGEENEDLLFSLERSSSVEFVPTRHEQGAAFMANVWGRLTGEAGVCLSTLGPGATNLMTGIADAFLDKSPVVAITGQTSLDRINRESHQNLNVVEMFKPITKWNASITCPKAVPALVRKAFKIAEMEKPGATHLELPENVARMEASGEVLPRIPVRRSFPDPSMIRETVRYLRKAKRPLILAGNGVIRKNAHEPLRSLVSEFKIPVVHTFMGQGAVSDRDPRSLYTIGFGFRDFVMEAVDASDLILCVGYDIAEYDPQIWNPDGSRPLVHIDFSTAEVYDQYQPVIEVVADIRASLVSLKKQMKEEAVSFDEHWFMPVRDRILSDIQQYEFDDCERRFSVPGVLNVLRGVMKAEDLIISDVGLHKLWIARNFPVYCAGGCIISNGLASMGIALPGAVAAALAQPERHVVAVMGDGGFLMNVQELETAKRLNVRFTVVVLTDDNYGQISWKQRFRHDHTTGTGLTNPNFCKLAESFGIRSYKPSDACEMRRQMAESVGAHELALFEIPVDQSAIYELPEKVKRAELKEMAH